MELIILQCNNYLSLHKCLIQNICLVFICMLKTVFDPKAQIILVFINHLHWQRLLPCYDIDLLWQNSKIKSCLMLYNESTLLRSDHIFLTYGTRAT